MAAQMEVTPHAVGQAQVRLSGLAKERAHQVRLTPPEGRGDPIDDVVIADREGQAAATIYVYAPGKWKVEARLDGSDEKPLASVDLDV